tara:strand:- start:96 stop:323 length:228 start_codon:yes stop_codon:yes gene_type:complete
MTPTIDPTDPRYFIQTSDAPYDRHEYVLSYNGEKELLFNDYEHLRAYWFEAVRNFSGCTVQVLDIKKKKSKGGFK